MVGCGVNHLALFEIYSYCTGYLEGSISEEWDKTLSRRADNIGISLDSAKEVLGVVLRDALLKLVESS